MTKNASQIHTLDDIQTEIEERAGVSLDNGTVPVGFKFAWNDGTKTHTIQFRKPIPLTKHPMVLFAMFHDSDEVRLYGVLAPPDGWKPSKDDPPQPFTRYTLSKHGPNTFVEVFPGTKEDPKYGLECFMNLIVEELGVLAADDEGDEAIDLLDRVRVLLANGKRDEALALLEEDEEEEESEEEEEESGEDEEKEPEEESSTPNGADDSPSL